MKVRISRKSLSSLVSEVIDDMVDSKELDEATLTGNIDGYNTPFAFGDDSSGSKNKKKRNATNSTGYKVVKEIRMEVLKTIRNRRSGNISGGLVSEDLTNRDLSKVKKIIRLEVAAILRDIWVKRSIWT